MDTRELLSSVSADGTIIWSKDLSERQILHLAGLGDREVIHISSRVPKLDWRDILFSPAFLFLAGFLCALYLMARYVARELFLIDVTPATDFEVGDVSRGRVHANILFLMADDISLALTGERGVARCDLSTQSWEDVWKVMTEARTGSPDSIVLIEHLENRMHDTSENRKKLRLIESLAQQHPGKLILVSASDPLADFRFESSLENGGKKSHGSDQRSRWQSVLGSFTRIVVADKGDADKFSALVSNGATNVQNVVFQECYSDAALQEIGRQVNLESSREPESVLTRVLENARSHYQRLWSTCSENERRALMHTALGGFVSPKNKHTVAALLQRGLLTRTPQLRTMNATFGKFIVSEYRRSEVSRSDSRSTQTGWSIARVPVLLLLVSVVLFLYLTQQQILNSTMAFISTASAFLPALFRLIGTISSDKGSNGKEPV